MAALLGVSAYAPGPSASPSLGDRAVDQVREALGGQLSPMPQTQTRWFPRDLEDARHAADAGDLSQAAKLFRAMKGDGVFAGVLSTRCEGVVGLPRRFSGAPEQVRELEGTDGDRSVFDQMFPAAELAAFAADDLMLGVAVAELVPVAGRDYPVFVRLDPEFLRYRWSENRWYYVSIAGLLPITPGDGRWVLSTGGGRIAPWHSGQWHACGKAWIRKEHADLHEQNWEAKLANPARAAVAPPGATEDQRGNFLSRLIAWGVNTVFELPVGWDVKLIESNGRGFESFGATMDRSDREFMIAIAGQVVTTDGGIGFTNADVFRAIANDRINATAKNLAHVLNTQAIPPWVVQRWGLEGLARAACVRWDTTPPKDLTQVAQSMSQAAGAIKALRDALAPYGRDVDVTEICNRFGIPVKGDVDGDGTPDAEDDGVDQVDESDPLDVAEDEDPGAMAEVVQLPRRAA